MERYIHSLNLDALCVHAGSGNGDGQPLVAPLVQSTTFCRDGVDSAAAHAYSRVSNPTVAALEQTLGQLEDAPPAVCFSSGLAAETALFTAVLSAGAHVVCGQAVYGGTTRLLQDVLSGLGVETTLADSTRASAVHEAVRQNTRLVFVETPANPTLELTDLAAMAAIAHEAGALLVADNTFMTPVLQQPLECGADVSVYSTTKFMEGHSVALGGALVSRDEDLLEQSRFVRKSTGGIQTPLNAWLTLQGLKTLPLRMRRQSDTAGQVADWLRRYEHVARVHYPSPERSEQASLAERQHRDHHGAVVSFELHGGLVMAQSFVKRLRLCRLVEHVGAVETLITHPASMTHADVPPEQRRRVGISDGLLRLSVGLEEPEAIIDDLRQAFGECATGGAGHTGRGVPLCPDVGASPGSELRDLVRKNATVERVKADKPAPELIQFHDFTTETNNDQASVGGPGEIAGSRLKFDARGGRGHLLHRNRRRCGHKGGHGHLQQAQPARLHRARDADAGHVLARSASAPG